MAKDERETCGIIMPISEIDGCSSKHWEDVRKIIDEVIEEAGFEPRLVSDGEPIGIIHGRIVQNLYNDPIAVCDVSCRNPNVMFELGMRLTFDKPTVIIKDNKTHYAFDASPIEHISYPRDLRYTDIEMFKDKLNDKLKKTYKAKKEDPSFSTFLKHFGTFEVVKPETVEVGANDYIMEQLQSISREIRGLKTSRNIVTHSHGDYSGGSFSGPSGSTIRDSDIQEWFDSVKKIQTGKYYFKIREDFDKELFDNLAKDLTHDIDSEIVEDNKGRFLSICLPPFVVGKDTGLLLRKIVRKVQGHDDD